CERFKDRHFTDDEAREVLKKMTDCNVAAAQAVISYAYSRRYFHFAPEQLAKYKRGAEVALAFTSSAWEQMQHSKAISIVLLGNEFFRYIPQDAAITASFCGGMQREFDSGAIDRILAH